MATLKIETDNHRLVITSYEKGVPLQEIFKQAIDQGLIEDGQKYYMGWGRHFFIKDGNYIKSFYMRDNWNGWHDRERWYYPTMEKCAGRIVPTCPSQGWHRDIWVSDEAE